MINLMKMFWFLTFQTKFNKVQEFIRIYDESRYLVLSGSEKDDAFYNRIRYLMRFKKGIIYVFPNNYARIKVDSYDYLSLEKTLTFHNVITHIKSVLNKDESQYY